METFSTLGRSMLRPYTQKVENERKNQKSFTTHEPERKADL
jgi:hypothetical protein